MGHGRQGLCPPTSLFPSPLGQPLLLPILLPSWGTLWASSEDSGELTFPLEARCLMMEEDTNDEVVSPTEAPSQEYWACVNSLDTFLIPSHSLHTRRSGHREAKRLAHGHTAASGRARIRARAARWRGCVFTCLSYRFSMSAKCIGHGGARVQREVSR